MLTGLGGGHVDNLTWSALDDNETTLSQGGTLHWVGGGGTGIGGFKGVFFVRHFVVCVVCEGVYGDNWL